MSQITIGNIAIGPLATSYQSFIADIPNDLTAGVHEFEVKIKSPLGDVLDKKTGTVNVLANGQSLELHEIQISTPGQAIDSENLIQGERLIPS